MFVRAALAGLLTMLLVASPASAAREFTNWHIHSGLTELGGRHRSAAFFPALLGVDPATYKASPALWAYCPDATDKVLVGGDGGRQGAAGVCMNETSVIHLLTVRPGQTPPAGWTLVPGLTSTYYELTPAG